MQKIIKDLVQKNNSKILMIVLDGVGGLPVNEKTELEAANKPNLDNLAAASACGLHMPVGYGVTPGSGPGHLGLFGYDPLEWQIGRGVLEALGLGVELRKTDIAIRVNYATIENGIIKDRRAGRPATEESRKITRRLQEKIRKIDNVEIIFEPGMEHRFAVVLRFPEPLPKGADSIKDTDPQKEGKAPIEVIPGTSQAEIVAEITKKLINEILNVIKNEPKANYVLFRGFSQVPDIPAFADVYGLNPLCIAVYPMYRGLARLIGMEAPSLSGDIKEEIEFLEDNYNNHDFFFMHIKKVDSYGEDGNFKAKADKISEFDTFMPRIFELNPDVLIITGDHSTPALMKSHSWHPVPVILNSPYVLGQTCKAFTERECLKGELGIFPTMNLMPLALANAGRLKKFGA
ncbi:MAG: 2,3-bisphosphoglycerate-independent phosphoglycerate mutase [Nitrospirae bacterium]|jgi:2,3-bisphosphoglycerate-independent phosphoglycerate mutase|nr:2,3-bisphosphoglycerate-independent phosphoglycerate mutase [Nitrospirota bacterium]